MKSIAIFIILVLLCPVVHAEPSVVSDGDTSTVLTPGRVNCDICGGYITTAWESGIVFTDRSGRNIKLCNHCFMNFMEWAVEQWKAERIGEK